MKRHKFFFYSTALLLTFTTVTTQIQANTVTKATMSTQRVAPAAVTVHFEALQEKNDEQSMASEYIQSISVEKVGTQYKISLHLKPSQLQTIQLTNVVFYYYDQAGNQQAMSDQDAVTKTYLVANVEGTSLLNVKYNWPGVVKGDHNFRLKLDTQAVSQLDNTPSSTDASSTDASSTDASSTDASSTDASSTDASSTDASSTDASSTDTSSTATSSKDTSSTATSSTDTSSTDTSSTATSSMDTRLMYTATVKTVQKDSDVPSMAGDYLANQATIEQVGDAYQVTIALRQLPTIKSTQLVFFQYDQMGNAHALSYIKQSANDWYLQFRIHDLTQIQVFNVRYTIPGMKTASSHDFRLFLTAVQQGNSIPKPASPQPPLPTGQTGGATINQLNKPAAPVGLTNATQLIPTAATTNTTSVSNPKTAVMPSNWLYILLGAVSASYIGSVLWRKNKKHN